MDYEKLTMEQIVKMRQDVQVQLDILNDLDDRLIDELSTRKAQEITDKLIKFFNF